jgi:hypothetical protein
MSEALSMAIQSVRILGTPLESDLTRNQQSLLLGLCPHRCPSC